jgi:hypothetical protein
VCFHLAQRNAEADRSGHEREDDSYEDQAEAFVGAARLEEADAPIRWVARVTLTKAVPKESWFVPVHVAEGNGVEWLVILVCWWRHFRVG